jgi:molecular chaperone GrpE
MATPYHPFDPRSRRPAPNRYNEQALPTLEDYEELVKAYRELQARLAEQSKLVKDKETEVQTKDEVIKRQSDDVKKLEGELFWARAAQEKKTAAAADEESWQERYQRLQAEVDNLRKRWEQRYESSVMEARHQILQDMLPLADHLDLALQHAGEIGDEQMRKFVENIESTRRAFMETLRRYGIERISADGALFDPNQHEAIGYVEDGVTPANHIIQVAQTGYVEGEKLLRPARVIVSKG